MATSFHNIIDDGKFEVNHNGQDRFFDLPTWLKEAAGLTENEEELLAWAKENEILLPLMQYGLKELIIALRAVARPNDVPGELKGERVKVQFSDEAEGVAQARLDKWVFKSIPRPGQAANKKVNAAIQAERERVAAAMKSQGIDQATIDSIINNIK